MDAKALDNSLDALDEQTLSGPPGQWCPAVVRLLDLQLASCIALEGMSREQAAHVQSGQTDRVLEVLARREHVVNRLLQVDDALRPFHERSDSLLGSLDAARRDLLRRRLDEISAKLSAVQRQDEADRAGLERQRSVVSEELAGVARARGAVAAYGGARASGGSLAAGASFDQMERHS